MDIFFQDPSEVPLPPQEVRIRELRAEPWPDGRRVKVYLEVDPFQKRPNADISILNASGDVVATASVIESITRRMEMNLHLRELQTSGQYLVKAIVYYDQSPLQSAGEDPETPHSEPLIVDRGQVTFTIIQ